MRVAPENWLLGRGTFCTDRVEGDGAEVSPMVPLSGALAGVPEEAGGAALGPEGRSAWRSTGRRSLSRSRALGRRSLSLAAGPVAPASGAVKSPGGGCGTYPMLVAHAAICS